MIGSKELRGNLSSDKRRDIRIYECAGKGEIRI